jgi:hypothetical protein
VCLARWRHGLAEDEALQGIDWQWLARDGFMTKAPIGGKKIGKHPTDRGKLGTKCSLRTDGGGVPIGLAVEGTNRPDFTMVHATSESRPGARLGPTPEQPQGVCLDQGYDDEVHAWLTDFGFAAHIRAREEEARAHK